MSLGEHPNPFGGSQKDCLRVVNSGANKNGCFVDFYYHRTVRGILIKMTGDFQGIRPELGGYGTPVPDLVDWNSN